MLKKIKITKEDIELDNVELPEGYEFKKYKTKQELKDEIQAEINRLESRLGEKPKDKELIDYGKLDHPYYQDLLQIGYLEEQLKNL